MPKLPFNLLFLYLGLFYFNNKLKGAFTKCYPFINFKFSFINLQTIYTFLFYRISADIDEILIYLFFFVLDIVEEHRPNACLKFALMLTEVSVINKTGYPLNAKLALIILTNSPYDFKILP